MNQVVANVTVVFCVAACLAGGIFAWWIENKPGNDAEDAAEDIEKGNTEKGNTEKGNTEKDNAETDNTEKDIK